MKNRIITISREYGSGGRDIGRMVAERLDIPCYDKEIIDKVAAESGFTNDYIKEQGEYSGKGGFLANALASRSPYGGTMSNQDYLWTVQRKIILSAAEEGPCVIVGRCADYILKDEADPFNVFIHALVPFRAKRIVDVYGDIGDKPEKKVINIDKRRASYYRFYTDCEWGKAQNYHITLDSGKLGIDRCADIIYRLYSDI